VLIAKPRKKYERSDTAAHELVIEKGRSSQPLKTFSFSRFKDRGEGQLAFISSGRKRGGKGGYMLTTHKWRSDTTAFNLNVPFPQK